MTRSLRTRFFIRILGSGAAFLTVLVLFLSCNDTGMSPYPPDIKYSRDSIGVFIYSKVADTMQSLGGVVNSYSISPALPLGLALNASTGIISGRPTTPDSGKIYTITAVGPHGSAVTYVKIRVKNDDRFPDIAYSASLNGPSFLWTSPHKAITPDTPSLPYGGIVARYSIAPALPSGVALDSVSGIISGTPAAEMLAKEYTVTATGPYGTDSETVYIGVYPASFPFKLLEKGLDRFRNVCADCHGPNGHGSRCPPIYHSDFLMADRHRPIRIQLVGLPNAVDTATTIVVNGDSIANSMFAPGNGDTAIAGVLTFIRAYFGGATDYITVQEVSQERDSVITANTAHNWGYTIDGHADY